MEVDCVDRECRSGTDDDSRVSVPCPPDCLTVSRGKAGPTTRNWRWASTAAGPTASNMQYMYKFIAPVLQFSRVMNNYLNVD